MKARHYVMLPFCVFGIIINGINLINHFVTPLVVVGFIACSAGLSAGLFIVRKEHKQQKLTEVANK